MRDWGGRAVWFYLVPGGEVPMQSITALFVSISKFFLIDIFRYLTKD